MPAWSTALMAAVVNDQDGAHEGVLEFVRGLDVRGHILVAALGTSERAIERVDDDQGWQSVWRLLPNGCNDLVGVNDQIWPVGEKSKRDWLRVFRQVLF